MPRVGRKPLSGLGKHIEHGHGMGLNLHTPEFCGDTSPDADLVCAVPVAPSKAVVQAMLDLLAQGGMRQILSGRKSLGVVLPPTLFDTADRHCRGGLASFVCRLSVPQPPRAAPSAWRCCAD